MTFDHIALIISIASLVFLFGTLNLLKVTKVTLINKNKRAASEIANQFGRNLDKYKFGASLLIVSGTGFTIWLVTRVVLSYT